MSFEAGYVVLSFVAATAVGYGTYEAIRDARTTAEREQPVEPIGAQDLAPEPVPAPVTDESDGIAVPPPPPPPAIDFAERDAVDPPEIEDPPKDTVLFGLPGVAGALDPPSIERTIKRYSGRYDRCLRKLLEQDQMRRGDLRLTLWIAPDGSVFDTSTRSTVPEALASCVLEVVKKLRFDRPTDGANAKVVYPMAFVPASPPE